MANWTKPDEAAFEDWLKDHQKVAEVARKYPPWKLYRMDSGHRCFPIGYNEMTDGSVELTVAVSHLFNLLPFGRRVFGIKPETLVECDLPAAGEPVGETLTAEEQWQFVNEVRAGNGLPPLTREEFEGAKSSNDPNCIMH